MITKYLLPEMTGTSLTEAALSANRRKITMHIPSKDYSMHTSFVEKYQNMNIMTT